MVQLIIVAQNQSSKAFYISKSPDILTTASIGLLLVINHLSVISIRYVNRR